MRHLKILLVLVLVLFSGCLTVASAQYCLPLTFTTTVEGHSVCTLTVGQRVLLNGLDYGGPLSAASGWFVYGKAPSTGLTGLSYPNNPTFQAELNITTLSGSADFNSDPTKPDPFRIFYRVNSGPWIQIGNQDDDAMKVLINLDENFQSESQIQIGVQYVSGKKRNIISILGLVNITTSTKDLNQCDETGIDIIATPFCGNFVPTQRQYFSWETFCAKFWTLNNGTEGNFDPIFDPVNNFRDDPTWRSQMDPQLILLAEPNAGDARSRIYSPPPPAAPRVPYPDGSKLVIQEPENYQATGCYLWNGRVLMGKTVSLSSEQRYIVPITAPNGVVLDHVTIRLCDGTRLICGTDGQQRSVH